MSDLKVDIFLGFQLLSSYNPEIIAKQKKKKQKTKVQVFEQDVVQFYVFAKENR